MRRDHLIAANNILVIAGMVGTEPVFRAWVFFVQQARRQVAESAQSACSDYSSSIKSGGTAALNLYCWLLDFGC